MAKSLSTRMTPAEARRVQDKARVRGEWRLRKQIIDTLTELVYVYNDLHAANENILVAEHSRGYARQLLEDNTHRAEIGTMSPLDISPSMTSFEPPPV